jgi:hypothetical protein
MKIFLPVLCAILVAAGIIYLAYEVPHDIAETDRATRNLETEIRRSDSIVSAYSKATPSSQLAKTLRGDAAVIVTKSVRVNIPRGEVIIPKGTRLRMLSETSKQFVVDYDGYSIPIPADSATRYFK